MTFDGAKTVMFCDVEESRALVVRQERVREAKIEMAETLGRMSAMMVVSSPSSVDGGRAEVNGEVCGRDGAIIGD